MLKRVTRRDGGRGAAVLLEACCAEPAEPRNAHENIVVNRSNSRAPLQRRTDDAQSNPETARPPAGGMQTHARARAKGHAQPARKAARKVQRSKVQSKVQRSLCSRIMGCMGALVLAPHHHPTPRLRALCLLAFCGFENGVCGFEKSRPNFPDGPLSGKVRCSPNVRGKNRIILEFTKKHTRIRY